jgi:hypothetical protein
MFRKLFRVFPTVVGITAISIPFLKDKTCSMKVSRAAKINHTINQLESEALFHEKFSEYQNLDADILLLFGVSKLTVKTQEDIWDTIEEIRKVFPSVRLIMVKERQSFPIEIKDTEGESGLLGAIRAAGDPTPRQFDLATFLFDKQFISKALSPIQTLDNAKRLNAFGKFELAIATCEADKHKKAFLKHLSHEHRFDAPHMSYFDFVSCETIKGNTDDLFLVKKHNQLNTPSHVEPFEVDGVKLNISRIPNFFPTIQNKAIYESVDRQTEEMSASDWKVTIAKAFSEICIFMPNNFADLMPKQYSLWLNVNLNRISQRQKKMILENSVHAFNDLPNDLKERIQLVFNPTSVNSRVYQITLQNNLALIQRKLYQTAKTTSDQKRLQAESPYQLNDRRHSYTYAFEPSRINWSTEELLHFIQQVREQNIPPFYKSQILRPDHFSNKLVLESFTNTHFEKKDHVVLFYSNNDPANSTLVNSFEQTALREIAHRQYPDLRMHHMNADKNTSVPKTPAVAYFKKDQMLPFVLQDPDATPEMVRQFIDATYHLEIDCDIYQI